MPKKLPAPNADLDLQAKLGAVVRTHRCRLGITQLGLARRAHMHRSYIADLERGERNATLRTLTTVAKALGVGAGELFS